jgi:hypothetical protein
MPTVNAAPSVCGKASASSGPWRSATPVGGLAAIRFIGGSLKARATRSEAGRMEHLGRRAVLQQLAGVQTAV